MEKDRILCCLMEIEGAQEAPAKLGLRGATTSGLRYNRVLLSRDWLHAEVLVK